MNKYFLLFCLVLSSLIGFTQSIEKPIWKKDTIINNQRFRIHNNWLSFGAGGGLNSSFTNEQFAIGVDYNFHIQKYYFQVGSFFSGDRFGSYNNQQIHLCYGKRKENTQYNFAYFGGLSYSIAYERIGNHYRNSPFTAAGMYLTTEWIMKIAYDVGIGASIFADINPKQSIIGIRGNLYLSGAYKGKGKR